MVDLIKKTREAGRTEHVTQRCQLTYDVTGDVCGHLVAVCSCVSLRVVLGEGRGGRLDGPSMVPRRHNSHAGDNEDMVSSDGRFHTKMDFQMLEHCYYAWVKRNPLHFGTKRKLCKCNTLNIVFNGNVIESKSTATY